MFRLRSIDELAEECGSLAKATALLKEAGTPVIFGMYDSGALIALQNEPQQTNVGKKTKAAWTLAPTDGLGAIKALVDPLELDIVRHLYRRTNYVTLRNSSNKRQQVKVYCINSANPQSGNASFSLTGFLREGSSAYYLLVCFDGRGAEEEETVNGPRAWALSRAQAQTMHRAAVKSGGESGGAKVGRESLDDLNGRMRLTLGTDSQFALTEAKQLGL